ncbi:MAG: hypothetical protein ABIR92_11530 [Gemmatimonadaceae bacterium]
MTRIMNRYKSLTALLCAAAIVGCEKIGPQDITGPLPSARIKFFNFGVNTPAVNFYANTTKFTAISAVTCTPTPSDTMLARICREGGREGTTGVGQGGAAAGGFYAAIDPGIYDLTGKIAATTDKDLAVATVPATIADGKSYSYFMSGIYNTTAKTVDAFMVEDPVPAAFDYTGALVRFVNAISNSSPMTLYALNPTTAVEVAVGGAVAYKSAGDFTLIPAASYTLNTRVTGSSTNAIQRTAVNFVAGRVYTITARGDITVSTAGTSANRPQLDNTTNR